MALIVEDGSIVAGANTYASASEVTDWATARGFTISTVQAELEQALIKAMDYFESFAEQFLGEMTDPANQALQWPRQDVTINTLLVPVNSIPDQVKTAQIVIAYEFLQGNDLLATDQPMMQGQVVEEKVGPLMTRYANNHTSSPIAYSRRVKNAMRPLLGRGVRPLTAQRG